MGPWEILGGTGEFLGSFGPFFEVSACPVVNLSTENEQKLIANLRNEPLWSQILRVTTFYAKFAIQSLLPDSYHQIQSRLRQLMQKCT